MFAALRVMCLAGAMFCIPNMRGFIAAGVKSGGGGQNPASCLLKSLGFLDSL